MTGLTAGREVDRSAAKRGWSSARANQYGDPAPRRRSTPLRKRRRFLVGKSKHRLDCTTIVDNDLVVVDDRVPGDSKPEMHLYQCENCHRIEWSEVPPECHGKKMSRIEVQE
jgi:hypothetical protein